MVSKFKSPIKMDLVKLENEVRQKAQEYLDDITEENLKSFAEATKYIAQSVLENYFLNVDDIYTNGALKIEDTEVFNRFLDFHDGYRALMRKWTADNAISLGEMKIEPSIKYPELTSSDIIGAPQKIIGAGTLVAVGLFIFTNIWIAVAAELLVIGTAAYVYKKNKKSQEKEFAFKVRMYEMQIEREKSRLVNGLIKDLKKWLENAEQYSNSVLSDLGVL